VKLFILRHGEAEPYRADDETRQLTDRGRAQVEQVMMACADKFPAAVQVHVSPFIRAQQTAAIALAHLRGPAAVTDALITPAGNPNVFIQHLEKIQSDVVLLVSHQPFVGLLAEYLCGAARNEIVFDTATLACIDLEWVAAGCGELRWLKHATC